MAIWILQDGIWPLVGAVIGAVLFWVVYRRITHTTRTRISERCHSSKFELPDGVTLFDNSHSVCARRVRIALLEKNIPFNKINIDLNIGEQFTKEYLAINPNGKVPALHIKNVPDVPDCTLYESNVIIEFLDTVFPGTSLFPRDPWRRTCVRMWQEWEQQLTQDYRALFYQNLYGFLTRLTFGSVKVLEDFLYDAISTTSKTVYLRSCEGTYRTEAELEHHAFACYKMLYMFEKELGEQQYLVGDSLSAADIAVFPSISMFPLIGLPIPKDIFPNVTRYLEDLGSREAFIKSEDVDTHRLWYIITRFERLFVWISNLRSGGKHPRFNGSAALSRASALYEDVSEYDELFDEKTMGRTLTEVPLSAETWQSTLLMMEKEMSFRLANGDVIDMVGRASGCSRLHCLKEGDRAVVGQFSTLEYIDRCSGQSFMPTDPLKKANVQCWQAWETMIYVSDIYPILENKVLSQILVTRYQDNIDSLMQLECSPNHSDRFPVIVKCFLQGMKKYSHNVTDMLTKYSSEEILSEEQQQESYDRHRDNILTQIDYLESVLKTRVYLVGDEVTLADMCVFCRLKQLSLVDIDIVVNRYPCVSKWMSKLTERPGFFAIAASAKLPLQLQ